MDNFVSTIHKTWATNAEAFWRVVRYGLVRAGGLAIYFGMLVLCVEFIHLDPVLSSMGAFGAAMLANYILSHGWVFRSKHPHRRTFVRYGVVVVLAFLLNSSIMFVTVHILGWWYIWGQSVATLFVPAFNFLMHSYWSFR